MKQFTQNPIFKNGTDDIFFLTSNASKFCSHGTDKLKCQIFQNFFKLPFLKIIGIILLSIFPLKFYAQTNISGIVNTYSAVTTINTPVCAPCAVGCTSTITVTDGTQFTTGSAALIIQMKGANIITTNTATAGTITAINNAGNYEFFIIQSIVGNILTAQFPLSRNYDVSGLVQVVGIPNYATGANIIAPLTAQNWSETTKTGGVLAIKTTTLTFNANIDVVGKGFTGYQMTFNGGPDDCSIAPSTQFVLPSTNNSSFTKANGIVIEDIFTNRGRSPRGNGGGSGVSGDSGGGGGSNFGVGGEGGKRWCDVGGLNAGGLGGVSLAPFLPANKVFLGGGGGAGFRTTDNPNSPSNGGGIVIIFSDQIVGNGFSIDASGVDGVPVNPVGAPDGGGGGGAGGTVVLNTRNYSTNVTIFTNGGDGQDLNTTITHGPGGGGGGGVLLYSLATLPVNITLVSNGGIGGQHSNGVRNDSQDGAVGGTISLYAPPQNSNYIQTPDTDVVNPICDLDDDNDGIPDLIESGGIDALADADGDGVANFLDSTPGTGVPAFVDANNDGVNDAFDTDNDGVINQLDLDADNDGIPDVVEAGGVDANGDGFIDNFTDTDGDGLSQNVDANNTGSSGSGSGLGLPDFDGDGIPNFLDLDADGDGIPDIIEVGGVDADNNGMVDVLTDIDKDGFADAVDGNVNGTLNTTIPLILTGADANNDGRPDSYPNDNADASPRPNFLDLDSDNDGINDATEAGIANTNGVATGTLGSDGWSDTVDALPTLVLPNTDSNGQPNYLDIDADNDGIPDNIEGQTTAGYIVPSGNDTDGDGIDNAYDAVVGNGGAGIVPTNTDGTDNPDYTDTDADNDGRPDAIEGWDTNGNGIIDGAEVVALATDTDGDGLLNGYDAVAGIATAGNVNNGLSGTVLASYPNVQPGSATQPDWRDPRDNDGDGVADINDLDDDNDGILDTVENGGINPFGDSDSDGIPNYLDTSTCTGGVLVNGVCPSFDRDGDGIINQFDLDADNDGIPDVVEAGGTDANGDGIVDNLGAVATSGVNAGIPVPTVANPYPTTGINFDFDGDGIPNFLDLDADGDGIPDIIEVGGVDADNNGMVDVLTDIDKDGFADAVDGNVNGTLNTTIPLILTGADANNDGRPDSYPNDNADASPRPNFLDLDSDNDGINDATEAGIANTNGVATGTLGSDGWSDTVDALPTLVLPNTDSNGQPNYLDIDADNDGIPDNIEGQTTAGYIPPSGNDTDGDGIDNAYDAVVGNGGAGIVPTNTDGTDNPDYTDTDADNDGRPDAIEGWDTNGNGIIDGVEVVALATDTDGDGLLNGYDAVAGIATAGNVNNGLSGTVLASYPNVQPGSATQPDWRDPSIGIGVAKSASIAVQPNGTFNVTFNIIVKNLGGQTLNNVQVVDNLVTTFPAPVSFGVVSNTIVGATANGAYTGTGANTSLLATAQTLASGASATITLVVNVTKGLTTVATSFSNVATGSGLGAISAITVNDASNNGSNTILTTGTPAQIGLIIDPNSNGNAGEAGENVPTPITFPVIGVVKQAGAPVQLANGTINIPFTIIVKNTGTEALNNVQVVENLTTTFGATPFNVLATPVPAATGATISPTFTGTGANTNLLAATQTLAVGASATITFTVNVTPVIPAVAYTNTAVASGVGAISGVNITDDSNNGGIANIDTDNDGINNEVIGAGLIGDNTPTPINLPVIGVAKAVGIVSVNPNGSYDIPFTVIVKNLGTETLTNVAVTDNLATTFPAPATFVIIAAPSSPTLTPDATFNGTTNQNLIVGTPIQTLAAGASATITFTVNIFTNTATPPTFNNTAVGNGTGLLSGGTTTDNSNNGGAAAIDPNNNGNPRNPTEDTPTTISIPRIGVAKAAGTPVLQGNGSFNVTFTVVVQNYGNEALTSVQVTDNLSTAFPAPAVPTLVGAVTAVGATPNGTYDGVTAAPAARRQLLAIGQTLAIGGTITITFTVNIVTNGSVGPFNNRAVGTAAGVISGLTTTDNSNNGSNPDIDNDGNPNEIPDNVVTPINLSNAIIGIAKAVGTPVINANGTINIPFTIVVRNLGNEVLNSVQVVDNLNLTFPLPATYTILTAPASGTLTANAGFNGNTNTNLLATAQSLAIGASATITFTVQITTNGIPTAFSNSAVASGTGATSTATTTDTSNNGSNTILTTGTPAQIGTVIDPDGNGNPTNTGENTPTPINFPRIGLAKSAGAPVVQANGTYNIPFTITVKNLGTEIINSVQVVENLATTFPAPVTFTIVPATLVGTGITANSGFTGTGANTNLVATTQTLAIGATATVGFTVNVNLNGFAGALNNQVTGTGTGAISGVPTTDISDNGTDPDNGGGASTGNGNPKDPNEDDATPINFPKIGVAKAAGAPIQQANGTFNIPFTIIVKNLGNETLNNVQAVENLTTTFGTTPFSVLVTPAPAATGATISPTFTGTGANTNLLATTQTLAAGASITITFTVNLAPASPAISYSNSVTATAAGATSGVSSTDISNNGGATAIDSDNNGNPNEPVDNTSTPINLPVIGIAKAVGTPVINANGTINIPFTIVVRNLGTEILNSVQVVDNLNLTFPLPATYTILTAPASGTLTANAGFNGNTNTNLLATAQSLAVGATATITFTVQITTNGTPTAFSNSAVANGVGATSAGTTTDTSNNGSNTILTTGTPAQIGTIIDPNGNGNPSNTGENTPTPITFPRIGLAKAVGTPVLQGNGSYNVPFSIVVTNYGNEAINNVQVVDNLSASFPAPAVPSVLAAAVTVAGGTPNATYTGVGANNLLSGTDNLAIGGTMTITFTVNVVTNGSSSFTNSAVASGTGATSTVPTTDTSNSGTNPDPNGNGNPNEPTENVPTPISITLNPVIGIAKAVGTPVINANGTINIPFTIVVRNLGTEILNSVQVVDNLNLTFPLPATYTILTAPASGTLTANAGFNGNTNTNLLATAQSLAVGATATITFTVQITTNGTPTAFSNSAVASGVGATSAGTTTDTSNNGSNTILTTGTPTQIGTIIDPNNNGNPSNTGENTPTPITFPRIGLAKAVGAAVLQGNGSYNVPFSIVVTNYGNEAINNVQVVDNLSASFPAPAVPSVLAAAVTVAGGTPNATYTGVGANNLLSGTDNLAIGGTMTITFTVNVVTNGSSSFTNSAVASGTGATSIVPTSDTSNSGTNPDPNGNGNPNEPTENVPTTISITLNPVIGIAKAVGTPVINANGTINIPFTIVVRNLGTEILNSVQVVDNLNLTFPLPATYTILTAPASGTLTANAGFNGNTNTNLLATAQSLAVGATATITFTVQLTTNGTPTAFSNSAVASGVGATSAGTTTDTSNNGSNTILTTGTPAQIGTIIDPNNNGNPSNTGENTPTPITFPRIGLAKAVGTPVLQGNGSYNVPFSIVVTNYGNEAINNVQVVDNLSASFPAPAVPSVLAAAVSVTGGTPNATYTGVGGTATANNLLSGTDNLAIGGTMTITFTVNVVTNGSSSFTNSAVASGTGATSTVPTTDTSNSGANPDPNGNGNPNEPTENVPTPISIGTPIIGLAKSVGTLVQQTNGSFNVPFVITVKNLGTEILNSVQVVENLALAFPAPAIFTLVGTPVATGGLTLATGYTGTGANINLLGTGNTLAVGATATITIVVNVNPRGATTAFTNTAVGTGIGANSNLPTTDNSNNGGATAIDTDGDNEPNEPIDNVPTPINLPIIGVAKNLVTSTLQANGTYRLDFAVIVKNMGTETLNNVQLIENLNLAFPAPLTFALSGVPVAAGAGLAVNATFTGAGANTNLLAGTSTLAAGVQGTVTFSVIVTLNNATAFNFTNTVVGNGTGATSGANTTDNSASGTNVDTDGDGLPNEGTPTPISLPKPRAVIGVSKIAGTPVIQPQGGFNVTYTIKVKNLGNVSLSNVNVKENLDVTFGDIDRVAGYEVLSNTVTVLAPSVMIANTAFNGKGSAATGGDINLLTATGNTLVVGAEATITLAVYVRGFGRFSNQVTAQGTGLAGGIAVDTSGNNTNVDENGNGIADEPAENQPTVIDANPIPVATDIFIPQGFSPNADGRNDVFVINGLNGRGADVKIYNRWGNLVFENNDYKNDWAGTANVGLQVGTDLPDATYFYIVKLTDGSSFAKYVIIKR